MGRHGSPEEQCFTWKAMMLFNLCKMHFNSNKRSKNFKISVKKEWSNSKLCLEESDYFSATWEAQLPGPTAMTDRLTLKNFSLLQYVFVLAPSFSDHLTFAFPFSFTQSGPILHSFASSSAICPEIWSQPVTSYLVVAVENKTSPVSLVLKQQVSCWNHQESIVNSAWIKHTGTQTEADRVYNYDVYSWLTCASWIYRKAHLLPVNFWKIRYGMFFKQRKKGRKKERSVRRDSQSMKYTLIQETSSVLSKREQQVSISDADKKKTTTTQKYFQQTQHPCALQTE